MGRAEGAVAEPRRQAAGGSRRGPPRRLRELRRRHPARQLRRRGSHRLGSRPLGRLERHRCRLRQGQAPVRAARPQAARQVDARQNEARQERVAAHQGARRVRDGQEHRGLPGRLRVVGPNGRAGRRRRSARCGCRRTVAQARRGAARAARARLEADARHARQAVFRSALGIRAQVRRLSPIRGRARRRGEALLACRPRLHDDVSRDRRDRRRAAVRAIHPRYRSRRARRARTAELRAAAKARPLDASRRRGARGARVAGEPLRVRPARVRRLRPTRAAARRAQSRVAHAAAGLGCGALLGALLAPRRSDVRRGRALGARRHRRQTRRIALRRQTLARLDQDQRGEVR